MLRSKPTFVALAALLLLVSLPALAANSDEQPTGFDAHGAFQAIKALEGEWEGKITSAANPDGRESKVVYKVSANGHSVIETFAPGAPHEMFSVYHMDGDELLMTHYCAIGNQPKMKFEPTGKPGELNFVFNGGTNLDPDKDPHAHEGRRQIVDANHYTSDAVGYNKGKPSQVQHFSMHRVKTADDVAATKSTGEPAAPAEGHNHH